MSTAYSVQQFEITVDHPGHGYAVVRWSADDAPQTLTIHELANLMHVLNRRVEGEVVPWSMPEAIGREEALQLLPRVVEALVRAVATADKAAITYADHWGPEHPVCVYCGEGSADPEEAAKIHGHCLDFGHVPFGQPGRSWAAAMEDYQTQLGAPEDDYGD